MSTSFTQSTKTLRTLRYLYALFGKLIIIFLLFVVINTYVFTTFNVDGHSMEPTLKNHQLLFVNLLAFVAHPPQKGDVVIVQYAGNSAIHFVKRVEGVPGDTVTVQGEDITLTADEYFVEGDNRDGSTDSRVFGPVKRSQILGQPLGVGPYSGD